jgi:hypothetical protein
VGGGRWQLDDIEVFLRDDAAVYSQPKLIPTRSWKQQGRNIDAEIGNLQPIVNDDVREGGAADQLIRIDIDQVDIEVIGALCVGHAKIQTELWMLKWEGQRLKVGEDADQ